MKKINKICLKDLNLTATGLFALVFAMGLLLSPSIWATTFGLKSYAPYSGSSSAPTKLFSFEEDGSDFMDIGRVMLEGNYIDADALSLSETYGLLAFALQKSGTAVTGSKLVSINSHTAMATAIGATLSGRDIRGAVFDQIDNLWVLDAAMDEVLKINPATGTVAGTPIGLKLDGNPFNLLDSSDIAVRMDGAFYVVVLDKTYSLDVNSGTLTLINSDAGLAFAGAAFSKEATEESLFLYEVNGTDDIFRYDLDSGFARTMLYPNIISSFNAGRGDLASYTPATVPEMNSWLLLSFGLVGLLGWGKYGIRKTERE